MLLIRNFIVILRTGIHVCEKYEYYRFKDQTCKLKTVEHHTTGEETIWFMLTTL